MPHPKWRSPLFVPDVTNDTACFTNNDCEKVTTNSSHTVTTEHSGLFGFILGMDLPDAPFEQKYTSCEFQEEKKNHTTEANGTCAGKEEEEKDMNLTKKNGNIKRNEKDLTQYRGCIFEVTFISPPSPSPSDNNSKGTNGLDKETPYRHVTKATVPFSSTVGDSSVINSSQLEFEQRKNIKVLTNTRIGRLIYLQVGTTIRVEQKSSSSNEENSEGGSCQREMDNSWRWGLVLHMIQQPTNSNEPIQQQKHDDSTNDPFHETKKLDSTQYANLNPIEAKKKPLVCVECGRKFPTAISARDHYKVAHKSVLGSLSNLIPPSIYKTPLRTVFENDDLVIVVKPQGMPVQGGKWTLGKSDLLDPFQAPSSREGALSKPRAVHRLDSATGGLLIVAKTTQAERELKACFAQRSCQKRYRAIVFGRLEGNLSPCNILNTTEENNKKKKMTLGYGTIDIPVDNKPSLTKYEIISYSACSHPEANGWITTVDLEPVTGRRHQLRKHLKALGHPIWGDKRYGPYGNNTQVEKGKDVDITDLDVITKISARDHPHIYLCLWALEISLPRPCSTGPSEESISVMIDEPKWYGDLRDSQEWF